ncbi:SAM-dependent methyltransferase [bacterium (Candidatus Moisslbacteria) CG12_big_fil_rev_8_21_14_0_65_36_11]|nr:MAG: SAM-dependent methyltransferase [bacterium (Candidatus Moisslbacteria) CG12_big_fil_rev_8_21_14_0_65_36_11]PIZ90442.1 MAG: SAM-dependent methyltransferase [bacterium (Candidatus Moisslbacteria) CG_4_10_14_0_2_um_filter_36_61]PJC00838.1 MAG: SAM-dependent methyltransferase [bacterium (Candidatus Moisslbacteria) CG_4_9_14_0_8_um_filter_36_20]
MTFYTPTFIIISLAFVVFLFISLSASKGIFFGAPWVPINKKSLGHLIKILNLKPEDVLYDLGSGDGRILIRAVLKYDFKKAVGIEVSGFLCFWSKFKIWIEGLGDKIFIKKGNLFKQNLSEASVVVLYLMPETSEKLKNKLKKETRPGTRIFSVAFPLIGWQPDEVIKKEGYHPIYFYKT